MLRPYFQMLSLIPWVFSLILACLGENSASIIMKDQDLAQSFQPHCLAASAEFVEYIMLHSPPSQVLAEGFCSRRGEARGAMVVQYLLETSRSSCSSLHRHREVLDSTVPTVKRVNTMKFMVQYVAFLLARSKLSPAAWNSRGCFSSGSLKILTQ